MAPSRRCLRTFAAALAIALTACSGRSRPDVLVIVVDTLRADRVGAYRASRPTTPHLDALAGEGVLFEETCAHAPRTWQSFVSILTGLYPLHHGVRFIYDEPLAARFPTLGTLLGHAGYDTAAFDAIPFVRDMTGGRSFALHVDAQSIGRWILDEEIAAALEVWLARKREGRPFFAFVRLSGPHWPYLSRPEFLKEFGEADFAGQDHGFLQGDAGLKVAEPGRGFTVENPEAYRRLYFDTDVPPHAIEHRRLHYDASVRTADAVVGRIVSWLRAQGRLDSTLVVVTSDHGESFGERGYFQHGPRVDFAVMRVPLVMRFPALARHGRAGQRVGPLVRSVDVMPTVLDTLGVEIPPGLDGRSLLGLIDRGTDHDRTCYGETDREFMGIDPELALPGVAGKQRMLRDGQFKLLYRHDGKTSIYRLYDLQADPQETRDVSGEQPQRLATMKAAFAQLMATDVSPDKGDSPLSPEQRERLRALGYVR